MSPPQLKRSHAEMEALLSKPSVYWEDDQHKILTIDVKEVSDYIPPPRNTPEAVFNRYVTPEPDERPTLPPSIKDQHKAVKNDTRV